MPGSVSYGKLTVRSRLQLNHSVECSCQEDASTSCQGAACLQLEHEKMRSLLSDKVVERCHRLGRIQTDPTHYRTTMVRFNSERTRVSVYSTRGSLNGHNQTADLALRIVMNEDHTQRRSPVAFQT